VRAETNHPDKGGAVRESAAPLHKPVLVHLLPLDNHRLAQLCGPLDENLRQIERALQVRITRRGERLTLHGTDDAMRRAEEALLSFYAATATTTQLTPETLQLGLIELLQRDPMPAIRQPESEIASPTLKTRRSELHGRTPRQTAYLCQVQDNDITFGIGPAGTGKTYLAVACAVDAFERGLIERIILTRPAVEAGERLGFLPGDMTQKVDPYLRPLYDALYDLMGFEKVTKLQERGAIEIAPLAFMRGRTLNSAFIILDEAQNTTPEQMKMFLTRIGIGSKVVVTGDLTQIDLPRHQKSGLREANTILRNVSGIAFTDFFKEDVVRHPLVARIVAAYERSGSDSPAHQHPDSRPPLTAATAPSTQPAA
jgi:phosphate starvation-inducible PhoH-like protein